jgi:L-Ala-D/L-Glu epimerase
MPKLKRLELVPLHVELTEPFGIATGAHQAVKNVLVRLVLDDGTVGIGEAAPVEHISGETEGAVYAAEPDVRKVLERVDLSEYRTASSALSEVLTHLPSARAGVEIALLDALTRRANVPLWKFFGGTTSRLWTDITVPTGDEVHAEVSARRADASGFGEIKIKVGGSTLELDQKRVLAVARSAPNASLILDGNTAFTPNEAIELISLLDAVKSRIVLFEQPVPAADLDGLREVESKTRVMVAADESLRSARDLRRIVEVGGISAVNIKTAKFGLIQAWDLLTTARSLGFQIMVGGMVETTLSMTTSACLAAGVGGVRFVDLDTPLFMKNSPFSGGFEQSGPELRLGAIQAGHGVFHRPA